MSQHRRMLVNGVFMSISTSLLAPAHNNVWLPKLFAPIGPGQGAMQAAQLSAPGSTLLLRSCTTSAFVRCVAWLCVALLRVKLSSCVLLCLIIIVTVVCACCCVYLQVATVCADPLTKFVEVCSLAQPAAAWTSTACNPWSNRIK
jgi:hypothetical protein